VMNHFAKAQKQLINAGKFWFIGSIAMAIGSWINIPGIKVDRTAGLLWFGFTGLLLLAFFVGDCTKAILAAISELQASEK
jgi:hypothetical protein